MRGCPGWVSLRGVPCWGQQVVSGLSRWLSRLVAVSLDGATDGGAADGDALATSTVEYSPLWISQTRCASWRRHFSPVMDRPRG